MLQKRKNSAILSAVPTPALPESRQEIGSFGPFEAIKMDNMEDQGMFRKSLIKDEAMLDEVTIAILGFIITLILESLAIPNLYFETEEWHKDLAAMAFILAHFVAFTLLPCFYYLKYLKEKGTLFSNLYSMKST